MEHCNARGNRKRSTKTWRAKKGIHAHSYDRKSEEGLRDEGINNTGPVFLRKGPTRRGTVDQKPIDRPRHSDLVRFKNDGEK